MVPRRHAEKSEYGNVRRSVWPAGGSAPAERTADELVAINAEILAFDPAEALNEGGQFTTKAIDLAIQIVEHIASRLSSAELVMWVDGKTYRRPNIIHIRLTNDMANKRPTRRSKKLGSAYTVAAISVSSLTWLREKNRTATGRTYTVAFDSASFLGDALPGRVGGISVISNTAIAPAQPGLALLCQAFSQLIARAYFSYIKTRTEALADSLYDLNARFTSSNQADSALAYLGLVCEKLGRWSRADSAAFLSVGQKLGFNEVLTLAGRFRALYGNLDEEPAEISDDLRDKLSCARPFVLSGEGNMEMLIDISSRKDKNHVIYPLSHLGEVIGFFACTFVGNRPATPPPLRDKVFKGLQYFTSQAAEVFEWRTQSMLVNPIYKSRQQVKRGQCCVLMPFSEGWSDRVWRKAIRPTLDRCGFDPMRADDMYGQDVMEDIWSMILSSDVVIADTTNRNPNVFYELGIAHTLGKRVILLTQAVIDIPFDLNRYRHIVYADNWDGFEKLIGELTATLVELKLSRPTGGNASIGDATESAGPPSGQSTQGD